MKLTNYGKLINVLNQSCEIRLIGDEVVFIPISAFMAQRKRDKDGNIRTVDNSRIKNADCERVRDILQELGFNSFINVYVNEDRNQTVSFKLTDEQNLNRFKSVGQLFEFERFSFKFHVLDKNG